MEVSIYDDLRIIDSFLLANTNKDFYQYFRLSKWTNFISKFFNFKFFPLVIEENNELLAFFPVFLIKSKIFKNHFISIPFCGHGGGMVIKKGTSQDNFLPVFLNKLQEMAKEKIAIIGDSFSADETPTSWITQLAAEYDIVNYHSYYDYYLYYLYCLC